MKAECFKAMLGQDFLAECEELEAFVARYGEADFARRTDFYGWTVRGETECVPEKLDKRLDAFDVLGLGRFRTSNEWLESSRAPRT